MLKPRNGFENSEVSFRVGSGTMTVKVKDITYELIERVRHHADLSYYVEEYVPTLSVTFTTKKDEPSDLLKGFEYVEFNDNLVELQTEYIPEEHDIETVLQEVIKKPRKKKK